MPTDWFSHLDTIHEHVLTLDRYLRRQHPADPTEPHSDREAAGHMHRLDLGRTSQILYGRVVDAIAYCHWYKVQPEGAGAAIPCCMLSGTSLTPFGVRDHNPLHPNAGVFFIKHPAQPHGVIIGVEPKPQYDATQARSDYVSLASRNRIQTEQVHHFPFTLPGKGSIVDWSAGRPVDATSAGERGLYAETGVGWFVDSAMAYLRADEDTGLWAFYRDQLARLSGHNLQIRATGGWEVEALDDQGEFNYAEGWTPYPWEQMGAFARGTGVIREVPAAAQMGTEPHYSRYEPVHDDQQPFHRTRHYYGYAGQGGKRVVAVPPPAGQTLNRYSSTAAVPGVFDETVALTGLWTVRTAKGVRIIKQSLIPTAKQTARPEAATGDTEKDYMAAGAQGAGPAHRVAGGPRVTSGTAHRVRAGAALDGHAYGANWEAYAGFVHHTRDWNLPEESALAAALGTRGTARLPFEQLAGRYSMTPPAAARLKVDHRYDRVDYYPTYSYFELLDDGGVLLGCGFGSEYRATGGNVDISAPGDINLLPGRRLVVKAGRDAIIAARETIDLSTTEKNVRVHAGKSMELAAEEGVLVESKAEQTGWSGWRDKVGDEVQQFGIHLKAAKSGVCAWGDLVYLRTGLDGPGQGFYLDAGKGEGHVALNASTMQRWLRTAGVDYFGGETVTNACAWGVGGHIVGGNLCLDGSMTSTGLIAADGWIFSVSAHVASARANEYRNLVPALKDKSLVEAQETIADCKAAHGRTKTTGTASYTQTWTDGLYRDGLPGNDQTVAEVRFSFRTQDQYGTTDFNFYEARWQTLSRVWGAGGKIWKEKPVEKNGEDTYPFPGRQKLADEPAYQQLTPVLYDLAAGHAADRGAGGPYADPVYPAPVGAVANESYRVI